MEGDQSGNRKEQSVQWRIQVSIKNKGIILNKSTLKVWQVIRNQIFVFLLVLYCSNNFWKKFQFQGNI